MILYVVAFALGILVGIIVAYALMGVVASRTLRKLFGWCLVLAIVLSSSSCAIGMRTPAHAHLFCEGGVLIGPGEYMGRVGLPIRGEIYVFPLMAGDTICLRRPPAPIDAPLFPDSTKPSDDRV